MAKNTSKKSIYIILPNHSPNIYQSGGGINTQGAISGGLASIGSMIENAAVAETPHIDQEINLRKNTVPSANSNASLMSEWSNYRDMGKVSLKDVGGKSDSQIVGNTLKAGASGAMAGTAIAPGIGTIIGGAVGLIGGALSGIFGRNKAKDKRDESNRKIDEVNQYAFLNFQNKAQNIEKQNELSMMSNYFNFGGSLNTAGGDYNNGLSFIDEGGLHEENPMGGIQIGVDSLGNPNLLEEGEVKFDNYVFSNSLKADKKSLKLANIKDSYAGKTFAQISKLLSKESKERPNDPISKAGHTDSMVKLMLAQEEFKDRKDPARHLQKQGNVFETGGPTPTDVTLPGVHYVNVPEAASTASFIPKYSDINLDTYIPKGTQNNQSLIDNSQWLRYAPVLGSALSVAGDITGATNAYDYRHPNSITTTPIGFNPIGGYLEYIPLDRNYYLNRLDAQQAATRGAIKEQSGGNRATAIAGLLASDYNATGQRGDLIRMAEEYNRAEKARVGEFNRATNMFNAEGNLKTDMFNAEQDYRAKATRAQMKEMIDSQISQARSQNLQNLFDNLGEVGREAFARNMINTNQAWRYGVAGSGEVGYKKKYGGKITYTKI